MSPKDESPKAVPCDDIPHERAEPRPDFSKPIPQKKLPPKLQKIVDHDASLWDDIYEGEGPETTDSSIRYAAYASRVRTILMSAHRYVAYTSDIGESFRPVAHPYLIRGAYAVSWLYLAGDVGHEGYKAYTRNQKVLNPQLENADDAKKVTAAIKAKTLGKLADEKSAKDIRVVEPKVTPITEDQSAVQLPGKVDLIDDYRVVMAQRAIFQGLASMGLPAFTIHSIVRYSGQALKNSKNVRLRTYGPIGLGLAAVPFLPFVFDAPVEHAVDWAFHTAFARKAITEATEKVKEL